MKYSHRTNKNDGESKLLSTTNKEKIIIDISSIPPPKPSSSIKRKLAQWRCADKKNNGEIQKKKESDNLLKMKDAIEVAKERYNKKM